ncbi:MAG: hypothetical protein WAU86_24245, partial [Oricola sp.]
RTIALAALLLPAPLAPASAHTPDGVGFVTAFRDVCLPERLSYEGMVALAGSLGWQPVVPGSNDELQAVFELADDAIAREEGSDLKMARTALERIVGGKLHHLLLSRISAPEITPVMSCSLYDLGATEQIDPQLVADLVGAPEIRHFVNNGLDAHSWGDTPAMPGTFQTVLTFVAEDSPHTKLTGFSGLVLKIDSSEPDAAAAGPAAAE